MPKQPPRMAGTFLQGTSLPAVNAMAGTEVPGLSNNYGKVMEGTGTPEHTAALVAALRRSPRGSLEQRDIEQQLGDNHV